MFRCPIYCYALTYPLAALIGLLYRFPVPFVGYVSGPEAFMASAKAVAFYSILGLAPVAVFIGIMIGACFPQEQPRSLFSPTVKEGVSCLVGAFVPVCVLAVLDKVIGPW